MVCSRRRRGAGGSLCGHPDRMHRARLQQWIITMQNTIRKNCLKSCGHPLSPKRACATPCLFLKSTVRLRTAGKLFNSAAHSTLQREAPRRQGSEYALKRDVGLCSVASVPEFGKTSKTQATHTSQNMIDFTGRKIFTQRDFNKHEHGIIFKNALSINRHMKIFMLVNSLQFRSTRRILWATWRLVKQKGRVAERRRAAPFLFQYSRSLLRTRSYNPKEVQTSKPKKNPGAYFPAHPEHHWGHHGTGQVSCSKSTRMPSSQCEE